MILDTSDLWDSAPLAALLAYQSGPKQAWDNTELAAPWLFKELAYGEAPMAPELWAQTFRLRGREHGGGRGSP
jgi:hypothetical protein